MTANIDITGLKQSLTEAKASFVPIMIYLLAAEVNRYEEFRTSMDEEGRVGIFDIMHLSYAAFHEETETFSSLWTKFDLDYQTFLKNHENDIEQYGSIPKIAPKPDMPENVFNISNIPWTRFSGFNLNLPKGSSYLLPIFTLGKYFY